MNDQKLPYSWTPIKLDADCAGCHYTIKATDDEGMYVVEGKVYCTLACSRDSAPRYSHQFLIAVTVESTQKDPEKVPIRELVEALSRRTSDIIRTDGREAFGHNDTEQV
jgi:hypothetical protein